MEKTNVDKKGVNSVFKIDRLCLVDGATKQTNAQQSSMLRTGSNMQFYVRLSKTWR